MNQDQKLRAFTWALIDALEDVRAQPAGESDWRDLNQADANLRRELEAIDALTATQQAAPSQGVGAGEIAELIKELRSEAENLRAYYALFGLSQVQNGQMAQERAAALLEASTQREQPAEHMKRWQILPTVKVRSTNQELAVTGVYEEVVFVDLPEQPAAKLKANDSGFCTCCGTDLTKEQ